MSLGETFDEDIKRSRYGRPMPIDAQKFSEILTLIRNGESFDRAAVGAGVAAETFRLYRRRNPAAQAEADMTREYFVWREMMSRCHRPKNKDFKNYGARGIFVCDKWRASFLDFMADMGPRPSAKHQIDRIDNSKGYGPNNCRWSTKREQMRNMRTNVIIESNGERKTMAEWADVLGVNYNSLKARLRRGWSHADALTIPFRTR